MSDACARERLRPALVVLVVALLAVAGLTLLIDRPLGSHTADLSSYPAGITGAGVTRASSLTENSNVPAAIMAVIPQAYGADPTKPSRTYTAAEQAAAIQNRSPLGPYQLVYSDVHAFAKAYRVVPLSFNEMADPVRSGNWLVGAAAAVIRSRGLTFAAVNFTAGTTDQPSFNPSTNRIDQRTLINTTAGAASRAATRRSWISILSALPISGIGTRAAGMYDTAFHWTVTGALSQVCGGIPLTYANPAVVPVPGIWTNPVSSTGILTSFTAGTHPGTDLAAAAGAPVTAVTSGQVRLVGSGSARTIVLYTGNALTITYQGVGGETVTDGQQVRVGQRLGTVSATPSDNGSAGPHLHLGINTVHAYAPNAATWVDPATFLRARSVELGTATAGANVRLWPVASTTVRTTDAASSYRGLTDVWQGSQLSTAAAVITTGQRLHVPSWGIQAALMTAMQGSRLGNELPPSSGSPRGVLALPGSWGTVASRDNVATAAQMFYSRLQKVPNWQTIPPWDAGAKTGAYAAAAVESYRAKWSGAGVIMNALGVPGTTSTYGTEGTTGGGCTGAPTSGTPTVNLSAGFRVASFNVLGCTWTYADWPSCQQRFPYQWSYINQHGFSIVGLQEVQKDQFNLFLGKTKAAGSTWAMYPTTSSFPGLEAMVVLWRTDQWQMVGAHTFSTPKWTSGDPTCTNYGSVDEPAVLLRNAAGQMVWAITLHNVAGGDAGYAKCQAKDLSLETKEIAADLATGFPVIVLGDFNDDSVRTICTIRATVRSATSIWDPVPAGGCTAPLPLRCSSTSSTNPCQPYDKILGTAGVTLTQGGIDWSTQTQGMTWNGKPHGITDHGVPSALAKLP